MKVKELIEELKELDQEREILIGIGEDEERILYDDIDQILIQTFSEEQNYIICNTDYVEWIMN